MFDVNWCSTHHTPVLEIATAYGLAMTNLIHGCVKWRFSFILVGLPVKIARSKAVAMTAFWGSLQQKQNHPMRPHWVVVDIFAVAKSIYPLCGFDILLRNSI